MDRPRRVVKQANRGPVQIATIPTSSRPVVKRNVPAPVDPEKQIQALLQSSKSDLVNLDMAGIINSRTWAMLSDDAKDRLKILLPQSAFIGFQERLPEDHPISATVKQMAAVKSGDANTQVIGGEVAGPSNRAVALHEELDHGFFTDPHLLSAMRTFQDHLYLNWFSSAHQEKVKQFVEGVTNGALSAPKKDEVWERDNIVSGTDITLLSVPGSTPSAKARGAAEVKLSKLVKNKVVRVGDVLAYKRSFASSVVIEKDCIIESTGPDGIVVSLAPERTKFLPPFLLSDPPTPSPPNTPKALHPQSATITSPSMLETLLLDIEGQLEKSRRPNGNAWKYFSIWRWRKTGFSDCSSADADKRGGRENHGTLFYLRGSFYNEVE
ncbi:hypothetical protein CPB83DRAFT_811365 [Crepidotus variabilis]|uniref:ASX DEUBAD domain-containing protein n=1 Tax=Crepidotus variabilis TaxID=179855 RepID=A0A9P6JS12_9AGAR|nr:hypothetical protein CPB83DRAFT_811365 [Crepidotus variabilis]